MVYRQVRRVPEEPLLCECAFDYPSGNDQSCSVVLRLSLNGRSIPHTMWVISHSNHRHVYLWRSIIRGSRSVRDNIESTVPDIT